MNIKVADKSNVNNIVDIHMEAFPGFFLTFLGKGFLKHLYSGFITHEKSNLLIAVDNIDEVVGFLAYSEDLSGFYKNLIIKSIIPFVWYSFCAFIKKPLIVFRLLRAFKKINDDKQYDKYVKILSIGVSQKGKGRGIGSKLIEKLKTTIDFIKVSYIQLETDADNNEATNQFYIKNDFILDHVIITLEGRKMNVYRYWLR